MNERATAALIVRDVVFNHQSLDTTNQTPLIKELCYGTVRWYHQLRFIANKLLLKPLPKKHGDIYCLLLVGLYQLQHMNIKQHAVVNETVNACRDLKKDWATSLINKILRASLRESSNNSPLRENSDASSLRGAQRRSNPYNNNLEAQYSHPAWLIKKTQKVLA